MRGSSRESPGLPSAGAARTLCAELGDPPPLYGNPHSGTQRAGEAYGGGGNRVLF